ncbi:MAG: polysaccharide biosynthesis protein, partial [Syntrophomonadaceae bacterium]|nr:polysaccharide biosynthesis protein [Syntrophomonadaceae bacterium]
MGVFSQRRFIMLATDAILINLAILLALLLRFDGHIPAQYMSAFITLMPLLTGCNLGFLLAFKLYGRIWEYASWGELFSIILSTSCSMGLFVIIVEAFHLPDLPRATYFLGWLLIILSISASRLWWKLTRDYFNQRQRSGNRVLIVGAGDAGATLVKEIQLNPHLGLDAVAFVDDDPRKIGKMMLGLPIKGNRYDIPELVSSLEIEEIIIAMPSIKGPAIRGIINICEETSAKLRILPHIYENTQGSIGAQVRRVKMEDLLGRHPVEIDLQQVCGYIQGKIVMVTGGGGSIGSELCRQLTKFMPRQLLIIDSSENDLFEIESELKEMGWGAKV